jgi:hypothetical protein
MGDIAMTAPQHGNTTQSDAPAYRPDDQHFGHTGQFPASDPSYPAAPQRKWKVWPFVAVLLALLVAYLFGHSDGHSSGYSSGLSAGSSSGYQTGYANGKHDGMEDQYAADMDRMVPSAASSKEPTVYQTVLVCSFAQHYSPLMQLDGYVLYTQSDGVVTVPLSAFGNSRFGPGYNQTLQVGKDQNGMIVSVTNNPQVQNYCTGHGGPVPNPLLTGGN